MNKKVFSEDEWKIMKSFRESGFTHIVRDYDGRLLVFKSIPKKEMWNGGLCWCAEGRFFEPRYMDYLFQNVLFEDDESVRLYEYVGF